MNRDELHELMLLYVIDGLDPDERAELQRLLDAGDAEAVRAYAEAAELAAMLPETLDPVVPSASVIDNLVQRAQGGDMPADQSDTQKDQSSQTKPVAVIGVWPKLAIAAAFVLGIGLTAVVMMQVLNTGSGTGVSDEDWADMTQLVTQQKQALEDQRDEMQRLEQQLATLQDAKEIDQLKKTIESQRLAIDEQRQYLGQLQESMALLVGPGVQQAELAGGGDVPDAQARLMWDPTTGQMRLLTRGLEPLKPGQTYQLWFVTKDGDPVSLGVFGVNEVAQTTAAYVNTVPVVPNNVNVAAISIEPAGGSPEAGPTGPIIMTGPPKGE